MNALADALRRAMSLHGLSSASHLVVLGSGLSGCFADDELILDLPHPFSSATHPIVGVIKHRSQSVLICRGRRHVYDGYSVAEVQQTIRAAAELGVTKLVLTNAAGGISPRLQVGDMMLINDGLSVMMGRFATSTEQLVQSSMFKTDGYPSIVARASAEGIDVRDGVYAQVLGPSYETRAEIRMLRAIGADAVGMSTLIEATAGAACGMSVTGISLITNSVADPSIVALDHSDVLMAGEICSPQVRRVIDICLAA